MNEKIPRDASTDSEIQRCFDVMSELEMGIVTRIEF